MKIKTTMELILFDDSVEVDIEIEGTIDPGCEVEYPNPRNETGSPGEEMCVEDLCIGFYWTNFKKEKVYVDIQHFLNKDQIKRAEELLIERYSDGE